MNTKRTFTTTHKNVTEIFKYEMVSLEKLAQYAQQWLAEFGPKAYLEIETDTCYDSAYLTAEIKETREETDEEYTNRLCLEAVEETKQIERKEARDRAEFKRLQAKFGEKK